MCEDTQVWIVEDDPQMRQSLVWLLKTAGHAARAFATPAAALQHPVPDNPGCLLLDLKLPGMDGLELLRRLRELGWTYPFVMFSGHANVRSAVASLQSGAVDFLEKPFNQGQLLESVAVALERDAENRKLATKSAEVQSLIDTLTPREREIMELVADGLLTKQIARQLDISAKTVEVHRSRITKKLGVDSVAQLVRMLLEHYGTEKSSQLAGAVRAPHFLATMAAAEINW